MNYRPSTMNYRLSIKLRFLLLCGFFVLVMAAPVAGQENDQPKKVNSDAFGTQTASSEEEPAAAQKQPAKGSSDVEELVVGVTFSDPVDAKWKVGARIIGASKTARNMLITIPVPNDWPEQRVSMASEEIPSNVDKVTFRNLDSGVKQLILTIPTVRAREETIVTMTFLVSTSQVNLPPDPTVFLRPKKNHKQGKSYLGVGPQI